MELPDNFTFVHCQEPDFLYTAAVRDGDKYLVRWEIDGVQDSYVYSSSEVIKWVVGGEWKIQEPEKERNMYIASNQIVCNNCGDSIFSMHRHDFVTCNCGQCSVDGGQAYLKRVGSGFKDISISIEQEAINAMVKDIAASMESGRNPLGVALAALRSIRDHNIKQDGNVWTL